MASLKTCFSRRPAHVRGEAHQSLPVKLERSRLGGWPLCIGDTAGERCDESSGKRALREMLQVRDIGKARPAFLPVEATVAAIALLFTNNMSAAAPKRALMVDSFAGAVSPLDVHPVE